MSAVDRLILAAHAGIWCTLGVCVDGQNGKRRISFLVVVIHDRDAAGKPTLLHFIPTLLGLLNLLLSRHSCAAAKLAQISVVFAPFLCVLQTQTD